MEVNIKNYVPMFLEGGAIPAEAPMEAPVEEGMPQELSADPIAQLADVAMQALQNQDCEAAMAVCEGFLQLIQEMQGGAPEAAPQGEPVYRAGGKLVGRMN